MRINPKNGKTLAELAIEKKRHSVLLQILDVVDPSFPLIFFNVFHHLIDTTNENSTEHITSANKGALPHTTPDVAEGLVKKIPTLASNGSTDMSRKFFEVLGIISLLG